MLRRFFASFWALVCFTFVGVGPGQLRAVVNTCLIRSDPSFCRELVQLRSDEAYAS